MSDERQTLRQALEQGEFAITVEVNPPKGTNVSNLLETSKAWVGRVHGVNVTDNTAAVMQASSVAVSRLLYEQGHDPVLQVTCRDRNRIGIQSDLLGAHVLGIRNVLCLTGDSPKVGDHKDAKPVYDMDSVQVMRTVGLLNEGRDLADKSLDGATDFFIGAAAAPGIDSHDIMHQKLSAKIEAGAQFFQTQAVYDVKSFQAFMSEMRRYSGKVLAGVLVLRSAKMAEYMNANIPGIDVPEELIAALKNAGEAHQVDIGVDIAVQIIKAVRPYCDGVHLMPGRLGDRVPEIIRKAGLN
ncbi:MAG: methylenetetrahydrofolate reductase [Nitrospirae bacterium]|nr:methylenetetrahydrofolate reductase [Nitrospirota bacterium]MDA1302744.1 methylenetetrahydrofolate reductase [Nitrospirota bacterium]